MHLMLVMEMIVTMKVIMNVVKIKRSHILYKDLKTLVPMKKTTKITWNKHALLFGKTR